MSPNTWRTKSLVSSEKCCPTRIVVGRLDFQNKASYFAVPMSGFWRNLQYSLDFEQQETARVKEHRSANKTTMKQPSIKGIKTFKLLVAILKKA